MNDDNNTVARWTNVVTLDPKSMPTVPDIPRITLSRKRIINSFTGAISHSLTSTLLAPNSKIATSGTPTSSVPISGT